MARRRVSNEYNQKQCSLFGQMCFTIGGGCLLVAFWFGSMWPVLAAGAALFVTLAFMNGLS